MHIQVVMSGEGMGPDENKVNQCGLSVVTEPNPLNDITLSRSSPLLFPWLSVSSGMYLLVASLSIAKSFCPKFM